MPQENLNVSRPRLVNNEEQELCRRTTYSIFLSSLDLSSVSWTFPPRRASKETETRLQKNKGVEETAHCQTNIRGVDNMTRLPQLQLQVLTFT